VGNPLLRVRCRATNSVINREAQLLFGPDCIILTCIGEPDRTLSRADQRPADTGATTTINSFPQEIQ